MGATTTLVTVQEFLQLPEPDGQSIELMGGEVVTMGRGGMPHEVVKSNLIQLLGAWRVQNPICRILSETMYQLDDHNSLMPDVSVLFPGRVHPGYLGLIPGAPEIAIEVVSSETAARLDKKIELYLANGSKSVWVVFPEPRAVRVFKATGQSIRFEQNQTLQDPSVLPGFQAPVSALFADI
jgi:Uma2 family endonuclease